MNNTSWTGDGWAYLPVVGVEDGPVGHRMEQRPERSIAATVVIRLEEGARHVHRFHLSGAKSANQPMTLQSMSGSRELRFVNIRFPLRLLPGRIAVVDWDR